MKLYEILQKITEDYSEGASPSDGASSAGASSAAVSYTHLTLPTILLV